MFLHTSLTNGKFNIPHTFFPKKVFTVRTSKHGHCKNYLKQRYERNLSLNRLIIFRHMSSYPFFKVTMNMGMYYKHSFYLIMILHLER